MEDPIAVVAIAEANGEAAIAVSFYFVQADNTMTQIKETLPSYLSQVHND